MSENDKRVAILIDAENISDRYMEKILDELAIDGWRPTYKRIYGDFTTDFLKPWNDKINKYSLRQIQQMSLVKGKNSSDFALIIDAMEILYSGNVEGICIVSSDSDFTRLAIRILEAGLEVIGMGESKTPESLVNACTKFIYLDRDEEDKDQNKKVDHSKKTIVATIKNAIENSDTDEDGWTNIGPVGSVLKRRFPDFDPRIYGAKSKQLSSFFRTLKDFQIEERQGSSSNSPGVYIRIKK